MKKLIFLLASIALTITSYSQAPTAFNYQAILRNSDGTAKANETVSLQISIVNDVGIPAYLEIHNTTTNEFGLVNLLIGEGTSSDDLSTLDWSNGPFFIDITVNGVNMGSSPLLSVPYALYAASGNEGPKGPPGMDGIQGQMGLQGPKGDDGDMGPQGLKGDQGEIAPPGSQGIQGEIGQIGPQGIPGDTKWDELANGISFNEGYVGLSTISPITSLHINAPHLPQIGQFVISAPSGQDIQYSFMDGTTVKAYMWWDSDQGDLRLQNNSEGDLGLNPYGGNVGVGTISPSEKLEVNGNLKVDGDIIIDGQYLSELLEEMQMLKDMAGVGTVTDIDGNTYKTVKIGEQIWMAENLRATIYSDGTAIPNVSGDSNWDALTATDAAYCWYNDDKTTYSNTYGALYTWTAAMKSASSSIANPSGVQGVCPTAWHLPSDGEWTELFSFLGGTNVAGGKLKETGTVHWQSPNYGATNESGFSALPSGIRSFLGHSFAIGDYGYWWSTTEANDNNFWSIFLHNTDRYVDVNNLSNEFGVSVRCIKD